MDTIKKISDLNPADRSVVERVFERTLDPNGEGLLILRVNRKESPNNSAVENDGVPAWCNVLEGFTDEDLIEFDAILKTPVRLAHDSP